MCLSQWGLVSLDSLAKSQKTPICVIPAKAGIQETQPLVDSRFRGSDGLGDFLRALSIVDCAFLKPQLSR